MTPEQEQEMLESIRNSNPEYQMSMFALAKECERMSRRRRQRPSKGALGALGADEQAISINVLPSSVASR